MNITALSLRSIAAHERDHKGHVELAGILECVANEIERLTAENERLRAGVAAFVAAWDSLPVGGHPVRVVQDWINSPALKSSVLALKAHQQTTDTPL